MKISDAWLQNAKPRSVVYDVTVTNHKGLMVRVHPSGTISFRFRYKLNRKPSLMVFGEYGKQGISLKRAYELHATARAELAEGLDPIEQQEERQRTAARMTRLERESTISVAEMVEEFLHRRIRAERWHEKTGAWIRDPKSKIKPRKRPDIIEALLLPNLVAHIGTQAAAEVTKRQLVELLDKIVDRGASVNANRAWSAFKQCFAFAAARDLIPADPMAGVPKPGGAEMPRDRTLNEDEIRKLWEKLEATETSDVSTLNSAAANQDDLKLPSMRPATKLAIKLLLVTGQRRIEITKAYWSQIDFGNCVWTIPEDHSKNSKVHLVPLSPLAIKILKELHSITGKYTRVLPAHRNREKGGSYDAGTITHAVRRNDKRWGIDHFRVHDLRRTVARMMASVGIKRLHVEKVLNHTLGDLAEVYDRHPYFKEKRITLHRWAKHLETILAKQYGPKALPFRRPARAAA